MSVTDRPTYPSPPWAGPRDDEFWRSHGGVGLVWSNSQASDEIMIYHALLRPSFHLLLDIAVHFGFRRLADLWTQLQTKIVDTQLPEDLEKLAKARPTVERCLIHMREGMARP